MNKRQRTLYSFFPVRSRPEEIEKEEEPQKAPHPNEEEQQRCCWINELLPDDLLYTLLAHLPPGAAGIAARTCRRWYSCCPSSLRNKLGARAISSSIPLLRWARRSGLTPAKPAACCVAAAEQGQLHILKWLRKHGFPVLTQEIAPAAARGAHLKVLQWLVSVEEQEPEHRGVRLLVPSVCAAAARMGHLEVLRWLKEKGCPWDYHTYVAAAEEGHLEVLQWIVAHMAVPWDVLTLSSLQNAAAKGRHLHILQWAEKIGSIAHWSRTSLMVSAAEGGSLEVMQWLRGKGCDWHAMICEAAAMRGHLGMLKWLREQGCPWSSQVCKHAARNGDLEMLQWARANG
ncbi:Ankyrin repeat-containing domain, partial [Balamuthia mandrillaris]